MQAWCLVSCKNQPAWKCKPGHPADLTPVPYPFCLTLASWSCIYHPLKLCQRNRVCTRVLQYLPGTVEQETIMQGITITPRPPPLHVNQVTSLMIADPAAHSTAVHASLLQPLLQRRPGEMSNPRHRAQLTGGGSIALDRFACPGAHAVSGPGLCCCCGRRHCV